jgi:excinuclease ABC subunit A
VVVDRIVVRPDMAARLADSFETALKLADGIAVMPNSPTRRTTEGGDSVNARPTNASSSRENSPAPSPASPSRDRAAAVLLQQPLRRLPRPATASAEAAIDPSWSCPTRPDAARGAIAPWAKSTSPYYSRRWKRWQAYGFKMTTPWRELPDEGARRHPLRHRRRGDHLRL